MNKTTVSTVTFLSIWHQEGWEGPVVEVRPPNTSDSAEWPTGAVERATFTIEQYPDYPYPDELPYVEHFGADGWPLHCPEAVKPQLDPRMQAELRRWPWTTRPAEWHEDVWHRWGSDYDRYLRWNFQAGLICKAMPLLPQP